MAVLRLAWALAVWLLGTQVRASVVVVGDASAPPLSELLPSLRVQTPEHDQRVIEVLPESEQARIELAQRTLAEDPEARVILWIAPDQRPYQGRGPYTITVARRLIVPGNIEHVRVDAETGPEGARLAALRVAEFVESAPEAWPESPEQTGEQPGANETPDSESGEGAQADGHSKALGVFGRVGGAFRLEPEGWTAQPGVEVLAGVEEPLIPLTGVSVTGALVVYPAVGRQVGGTEVEVAGLEALLRVRWLSQTPVFWGIEGTWGARSTQVATVTADGAQGSVERWSVLLAAHLALGLRWGRWRLVSQWGSDFSLTRRTYTADAQQVFGVAGWAPSVRLGVEASF